MSPGATKTVMGIGRFIGLFFAFAITAYFYPKKHPHVYVAPIVPTVTTEKIIDPFDQPIIKPVAIPTVITQPKLMTFVSVPEKEKSIVSGPIEATKAEIKSARRIRAQATFSIKRNGERLVESYSTCTIYTDKVSPSVPLCPDQDRYYKSE